MKDSNDDFYKGASLNEFLDKANPPYRINTGKDGVANVRNLFQNHRHLGWLIALKNGGQLTQGELDDTEPGNTLRVFLEDERNYTKAAKELFIHRSTLIYRVKRIEEITGLDLEDAKTRIHLVLSYRLHYNDI